MTGETARPFAGIPAAGFRPAGEAGASALEDHLRRLGVPNGIGSRGANGNADPPGASDRAPSELPPPGRPAITVSYAQSLDGSIAALPGEPLRLSGARALGLTHRLRARHDAILVGIGTVLADDPRLNVRLAAGRSPTPVVLDSRLRLPGTARLLRGDGRRPALVATTRGASAAAVRRLRAQGAEVIRFAAEEGRVPLRRLLRALARRGVRRLLVEGGGRVLTSLFAARLADAVVVTVAPRLVGGEPVLTRVPAPVTLRDLAWSRYGDDLVFAGRPRFGVRAPETPNAPEAAGASPAR